MQHFKPLTTGMSVLVGLLVLSCTTLRPLVPPEETRGQTLKTLDAFQVAQQQDRVDVAKLQADAVRLREQLTVLCSPYLTVERPVGSATAPLAAKAAPPPVAPSSAASPSQETPSAERLKEYNEGLE